MKDGEIESPLPWCRAYRFCGCLVMAGIEAGKWHMSISHQSRYPLWSEICAARRKFLPDGVTMAMLLPGEKQWVNIHKNCFHLHEIEDEGWSVFDYIEATCS